MEWTRLLSGPAAREALGVAAAIAARRPAEPDAPVSGSFGAALFLAAYGEATSDPSYLDAAAVLVEAEAGREVDRPTVALYGSPVGLGWAWAVLADRLPGDDRSSDDTDVDAFVTAALDVAPWPGPLDLVYGLAGLGTYALARLPRDDARRNLDRVVTHLADAAREEGAGLTWPYLPPWPEWYEFSERRPEGHVDVGFAHGVAGIVAFLAAATEAGVAGARELLEPAVRWLVDRRLGTGGFPGFVVPGRPAEATRMAWCYGEPGVAVALLAAGEVLGDAGLVGLAADVAAGCEDREGAYVRDASLCHGSAGLGHLLNRIGQVTGDERVLALARRWFETTLRAPRTESDGPGLLTGPSGVGLALLSAATDVEPWWDQVLLVRPPGRWGARVSR